MSQVLKKILHLSILLTLLVAALFGINRYNSAKYGMVGADRPNFSAPERVLAEGNTTRVIGDYLNGFYFPATTPKKPGTVIVFGGSEGSANPKVARWLQTAGYDVLALYFFGQPGQQPQLSQVPLEFFQEALDWIAENKKATEPITVLGLSKGAELSANLAARYPQITNLICYSPAEYTYAGLDFRGSPTSSFTYGGNDVSFLTPSINPKNYVSTIGRYALGLPVSYRPSFEQAIEQATDSQRDQARIDLSAVTGNILLLAGEDDAMWPAETAARNLSQRYPNVEAVIYPEAGHLFADDITSYGPGWKTMFGGTVTGNREAKAQSDALVLDRLSHWHQPKSTN